MNEKQYFPVPLAHLTSPFVPPQPAPERPPPTPGGEPPPSAAPHVAAQAEEEPSGEPWGMLDVVEPPEIYGVDEVTLAARDPYTLFVHWETTAEGRESAGARLGAEGDLVLRLIVAAGGPSGVVIDDPLATVFGRGYVLAPHPGALVVGVLGLRAADGRFEAIASAPTLRVPYHDAEQGLVDWVEIPPATTRGLQRERPEPARRGPAAEIRGAAQARVEPAAWHPPAQGELPPTSPAPTSPTRGRR